MLGIDKTKKRSLYNPSNSSIKSQRSRGGEFPDLSDENLNNGNQISKLIDRIERSVHACTDSIAIYENVKSLLLKYCEACGLHFPSGVEEILLSNEATHSLGVEIFWLLHVNKILKFEVWLVSSRSSSNDDTIDGRGRDAQIFTAKFVRNQVSPTFADVTKQAGNAPFRASASATTLSTLLCGDVVAYLHALSAGSYGDAREAALHVLHMIAFGAETRGYTSPTWVLEEADLVYFFALLGPNGTLLGGAGLNWQVGALESFLSCAVSSLVEVSDFAVHLRAMLLALPPNSLMLAFERILCAPPSRRGAGGATNSVLEMVPASVHPNAGTLRGPISNPLDANPISRMAFSLSGARSVLSLVLAALADSQSHSHSHSHTSMDAAGLHGRKDSGPRMYFSAQGLNSLLALALQVVNSSLASGAAGFHCVQRAMCLAETVCAMCNEEERSSPFTSADAVGAGTGTGPGHSADRRDVLGLWLSDMLRHPATCEGSPSLPPLSTSELSCICAAVIPIVEALQENTAKRLFAILRSMLASAERADYDANARAEVDALLRSLRSRLSTLARQRDPMCSVYRAADFEPEGPSSFHSRGSGQAASGMSKDDEGRLLDSLRSKVPMWVRSLDAAGALPVGVGSSIAALGGQIHGGRALLRCLRALAEEESPQVTRDMTKRLVRSLASHVPPLISAKDADVFLAVHTSKIPGSDITSTLLAAFGLQQHESLCREIRGAGAIIEQAMAAVGRGEMLGAYDEQPSLVAAAGSESNKSSAANNSAPHVYWTPAADRLAGEWTQRTQAALLAAARFPADADMTTKTCALFATLLQQLLRDVSLRIASSAESPVKHLPTAAAAAAAASASVSRSSSGTREADERQFIGHYLCLVRHLLRAAASNDAFLRCLVCCLAPSGHIGVDICSPSEAAQTFSAGLALACLDFPASAAFVVQIRCNRTQNAFSQLITARIVHAALFWQLEEGVGLSDAQAVNVFLATPTAQVSSYTYLMSIHTWLLGQISQMRIKDPFLKYILRVDRPTAGGTRAELGAYLTAQRAIRNWVVRSKDGGASCGEARRAGWVSSMSSDGPYAAFVCFVDADRNAIASSSSTPQSHFSLVFEEVADFVTTEEMYRAILRQGLPPAQISDLGPDRLSELFPPASDSAQLSSADGEEKEAFRGRYSHAPGDASKTFPDIWAAVLALSLKIVTKCPGVTQSAPAYEAGVDAVRIALSAGSDDGDDAFTSYSSPITGSWAVESCPTLLTPRAKDVLRSAVAIACAGPAAVYARAYSSIVENVLPRASADFSATKDSYRAQVVLFTLMEILRRLCDWSTRICRSNRLYSSSGSAVGGVHSRVDDAHALSELVRWVSILRPSVSQALGCFDRTNCTHLMTSADLSLCVEVTLSTAVRPPPPAVLSASWRIEKLATAPQAHTSAESVSTTLRFLTLITRYVFLDSLQEDSGAYDADAAARSRLFLRTTEELRGLFSYAQLREVCRDLGWHLLSFMVALSTTVGEANVMLAFFFPKKRVSPTSGIGDCDLYSLLRHMCMCRSNDSCVSDEDSEDIERINAGMCSQIVCSSLVHLDRNFGLYASPFRGDTGSGPPALTEKRLGAICIQYVLPVLASYFPVGEREAHTHAAIKAALDDPEAGLPACVRSDCLDRFVNLIF